MSATWYHVPVTLMDFLVRHDFLLRRCLVVFWYVVHEAWNYFLMLLALGNAWHASPLSKVAWDVYFYSNACHCLLLGACPKF